MSDVINPEMPVCDAYVAVYLHTAPRYVHAAWRGADTSMCGVLESLEWNKRPDNESVTCPKCRSEIKKQRQARSAAGLERHLARKAEEREAARDYLEKFEATHCKTCKRLLDEPGAPASKDCGGDCLACMASFGDTDCIDAMRELTNFTPEDKQLVSAALEAAAKVCDAKADEQEENNTKWPRQAEQYPILVSCIKNYRDCARDIRAIEPQTIIDALIKENRP